MVQIFGMVAAARPDDILTMGVIRKMSTVEDARRLCLDQFREIDHDKLPADRKTEYDSCIEKTGGGYKKNASNNKTKVAKPQHKTGKIHVGPKGGRYTLSKTGKKQYM